jgi:hypothetical protein
LPPCVSMIPAGEALAAIHTPFCFHTCWLTCSANFENYLGPLVVSAREAPSEGNN